MNRSPAARGVSAVGVIGVLAALVSRGGVGSEPVGATAGPFQCQPGFYQVISGQLYELNPVTSVYTKIGAAYSTSYNAMGFNVLDDYLYAMGTGSANDGDLLRVADDGSVTDLGRPAGLPSHSFVSGDMDGSGDLLVQYSGSTWYSIKVSAGTATSFTVSGQQGSGDDAVWINGDLYFASGTTLYTINLSSDTETKASVSGLSSSGAYGAAWSDKPSDLFVSDNNTGDIYQIANFTGSSPTASQVATGQETSDNDGAACKQAASPFVLPVANPDTYPVTTDVTLSVDVADGVLANDSGAGLSVLSHTNPSDGTLTLNANGSFTYVPDSGFVGTDSFTYSVQDEYGRDSASATTVSLDVSLPPAPQASNDSYTTTVGTTLTETASAGPLANDTGTGIAITSHTSPASGSLSLQSNGAFSYAPAADSSGVETFSYTIADSFARTSTAEVTIAVTPTVEDGSTTTAYDTPLTDAAPGVLDGALGSGLTVPSYGQPLHGTVVVGSDGGFTYTPEAGFDGTDSFTFVAEDAAGQTVDGSFSVGVGSPAAPEASAYGFTVAADSSLVRSDADGVLLDDSGASIRVTSHTDPAAGSLSLDAGGGFTYTPTSGFSGDDSFSYTITDAVGQTASATVYLDVTPVAVTQTYDTSYATSIGVNVLSDDIGSGLSIQYIITAPGVGEWSASGFGTINYEPPAGFAGTVEFTYDMMDGSDQSVTGTLYYVVGDPAAPVVGSSLDYTTTAGQSLDVTTGGLLTGATGVSIQVVSYAQPAHGSVSVNADGSFEYQPAAGFSGVDHFDFTIGDPFGQTASGEATVTVEPMAKDISYSTPCGAALSMSGSVGLLAPDLGTSLVVSAVSGTPAVGDLDWQADGSFTFTPGVGACAASGGFDYTIADQDDQEASATVTFEVGPPAAVLNLSYSADEGFALEIGAGGGLVDWSTAAGVTVASYTQPSHGSVSAGPDGSFTYTPAPGYSGPDSFTYTAQDAGGVLGIGTVTISVAPAGGDPATAPTPDTGVGPGALGANPAMGAILIALGAVSLLAVRRRRRLGS